MPTPIRWKRWMPRLAVESVVVVFSILLALVVNEWRQEREQAERSQRAKEAIRAELLHNHRQLARVHPYHDRLADTLRILSAGGVSSVEPGVRPKGWIRNVDLVSAAWDAAAATGATARFDYPILLATSRAYGDQRTFLRRTDGLISSILDLSMGPGGGPTLLGSPGGMAAALSVLSDGEANLLREYERALSALGVPADSLERAAARPSEPKNGSTE